MRHNFPGVLASSAVQTGEKLLVVQGGDSGVRQGYGGTPGAGAAWVCTRPHRWPPGACLPPPQL